MIEDIENPDPNQTEEQRDEMVSDTRKVAQCVLDGNRYQGIGHRLLFKKVHRSRYEAVVFYLAYNFR